MHMGKSQSVWYNYKCRCGCTL